MNLDDTLKKFEKIIYDKENDNMYLVIHRLGKGAFAQVWCSLCIYNFFDSFKQKKDFTTKFVALKINFSDDKNHNKKSLVNEFKKLKSLDLKSDNKLINIPLGAFEYKFNDYDYFVIVMNIGSMSIGQYLTKLDKINVNLMFLIIYKMCKSIELIHKKGYVFNDVSPDNFIVFEKNETLKKIKDHLNDVVIEKMNKIQRSGEFMTLQTNNNKNKKRGKLNIKFNYSKLFEKLTSFIIEFEKKIDDSNIITNKIFKLEEDELYSGDEESEEESEYDESEDEFEDESNNKHKSNKEYDINDNINYKFIDDDNDDDDSEDDNDTNTDIDTISTTYKYYSKNINTKCENKIINYINIIDTYIKYKNPEENIYDKSLYYSSGGDNINKKKKFEFIDEPFNQDFDIRLIDPGKMKENGKFYGSHQARYYRPPEVILGYEYDYKIDYWALGCTIWELCTNEPLIYLDDHIDKERIDMDIINLQKIIDILPEEKNNLIKMIKNSKRNRKLFDNKLEQLKFCKKNENTINIFDCFNIVNIAELINKNESKITHDLFFKLSAKYKVELIGCIIANLIRVNVDDRRSII